MLVSYGKEAIQLHNDWKRNNDSPFLAFNERCTVAQKTVSMFTHFGMIDLLWHADISKLFKNFRQSIMAF